MPPVRSILARQEGLMTGSNRFPTHHVPDEGVRYAPGDLVRIDQSSSSGRIDLIKDPDGEYEVMNSRPATEYTGGPPLLRIDLRRRGNARIPAPEDPPPWPVRPPRTW
jgi:hypothetical protein